MNNPDEKTAVEQFGRGDKYFGCALLLATSLVMLMTPRLAFFHGGLVGRKNVLGIMIINKITPVKVTAEEESLGLDSALHGEEAYLQD